MRGGGGGGGVGGGGVGGGGIHTTLHSNDREVRSTITAYQCGTCTTLDSVQLG